MTFLALTLFPAPPASADLKAYITAFTLLPLLKGGPLIDPSYWSIAIELQFYLAIFVVMAFAGLRYLLPLFVAWLCLNFVAMTFDGSAASTLAVPTLCPYSAFFVFGILLYTIRYENAGRVAKALIVPAIALGGLQMSSNYAHVEALDGVMSPWWTGLSISLTTFAVVSAFCFRITSSRWSSIAAKLGAVSYPLYLLYQSFGFWMIHHRVKLLGNAHVLGPRYS